MLSATYGVVEPYAADGSHSDVRAYGDVASYVDIEALRNDFRWDERPALHVVAIVMVSDVPPPLAVKFMAHTIAAEGDAPWENLAWRWPRPNGTGALAIGGDTWEPPLAIKGQSPDTFDGSSADAPGVGETGGTWGAGGVTSGILDHVRAGAGERLLGFLTNSDRGIYAQFGGNSERAWWPLPPADSMANYLSALAVAPAADDPLRSPLGRAASHRDAAFDDFSADALLLASDQSTLGEERKRSDLGDDPKSDARTSDDEHNDADSLFDETTKVALDALARERRAIAFVLEALNDIEITDGDTSSVEPATYRQRDAPRDQALEDWRFDFGRAATTAAAYDTEGGMVLLENSGDANSNAYDLTAVFVTDINSRGDGRHAVDAALGIYQAIDIGASELNGTSKSGAPIAKPALAAPASLSVDDDLAQKSGQRF